MFRSQLPTLLSWALDASAVLRYEIHVISRYAILPKEALDIEKQFLVICFRFVANVVTDHLFKLALLVRTIHHRTKSYSFGDFEVGVSLTPQSNSCAASGPT